MEENPSEPIQKQPPVIIKKSNNLPLVGAIIFLALVVGAAAIYLGMRKPASETILPPMTPTPTIESSPTITTAPTSTVDETTNWEVANIPKTKDLSFSGYSVKHPEDWAAKETKDDISHTLTITKGTDVIKIYQAPMGGNQCVFEGDMSNAPANDYRKTEFVEIKAGDIALRRIPGKTQSFCSNSPQSKTSFGIPTIFGSITYTVSETDSQAISQMDKIISTLKQTP